MTTYEHGLKRTTDLIGLLILSFVEQAQERCSKTPCEAFIDITIAVIEELKAQRRRVKNNTISKDPLRDRVLQEIVG